jgi:hypothetical protein
MYAQSSSLFVVQAIWVVKVTLVHSVICTQIAWYYLPGVNGYFQQQTLTSVNKIRFS